MEILARRKCGIQVLLIFEVIIGMMLIALGLKEQLAAAVIAGVAEIIIGIVMLILFAETTETPVILEDNTAVILKGKTRVTMSDIQDITYRRASARGVRLKYGTLKISTAHEKYKVYFVDYVEHTAETLKRAVNEANKGKSQK